MRRVLLSFALLCCGIAAVAQQSTEPTVPENKPAAAQATVSTPKAAAQTTEQTYTQGWPTHWIEAPDERWWLPRATGFMVTSSGTLHRRTMSRTRTCAPRTRACLAARMRPATPLRVT